MKKPLLIVVALLVVVAAALFMVMTRQPSTGPASDTATTPPPSPAPATPNSQPAPRKDAPAPAPPAGQAKTSPKPLPTIPKHLQDPRALDPVPLKLNLSGPPFERQKDGRIFKRDVVNSLSDLNDPNRETIEDLQALTSVVGAYRMIFQQNPIAGENREVVEALTGQNLYKIAFVDPAHPAINADGELVDRWGNPFRFHAISREKMEILSSGEDGQFGTGDDVMIDEPVVFGDTGAES